MVVRNVMDALDQEEQRAAQRSNGSFVPLFLTLKDKQKALVRPLVNFDSMLVLAMHNKFNQASPKDSINAVCASEIEEECIHCFHAKDDKKLSAGMSFFLPVWLYSLKQQKKDANGAIEKDKFGSPVWEEVTYEDSDGNKKPVQGFRVLELKRMGTINDVLQFFRKVYADSEYDHNITTRDFIIERVGGDQKTTYTTLPRAPKPMTDEVKGAIPTLEELRAKILEKCPPVSNATPVANEQGKSVNGATSADDEDF